jgi:hypothetical protein
MPAMPVGRADEMTVVGKETEALLEMVTVKRR